MLRACGWNATSGEKPVRRVIARHSALQVCIAHQIYPLSNPLSAGLRRIFEHPILALNFVDFSSTFVRLYF